MNVARHCQTTRGGPFRRRGPIRGARRIERAPAWRVFCHYNDRAMASRRRSNGWRIGAGLICASVLAAAPAAAPTAPARPGPAGRATTRPAAPPLAWPLDVPGTLLSAFGEYRYDHVHAGIDISTSGATGHRVLAAAAGVIYRLKVEWRGYGRALYIRHPDGRITVYAHLERYEDARLGLERRVTHRRRESGTRYPGDILLDPPVPVSRGQVIAFSGESGVGLPHLHFEVRDGEDHPVDPLSAGLRAPRDERPPVVEELIITAADPETFVDGARRERVYPLARREGIYQSAVPVRVTGPFVPAIIAHDAAGREGRSGVKGVRLEIDGTTIYDLAWRSFAFGQYPQAGLIYDHRYSRLGPARYAYRLIRLPGNELATGAAVEAADPGQLPGSIALPPGAHRIDIRVVDAAGNTSRARICLFVARPPAVTILGADARDTTGAVRFALAPPAPTAPPSGAIAATCRAPAPRVEGEIWDGGRQAFMAIGCRGDTGTCLLDGRAGGTETVVRLRASLDGVPGPWTLAPVGRGLAGVADAAATAIDTWPSFLDLRVPVSLPAAPPLAVVAWPGGGRIGTFAYRDAREAGAAIAYARAAAAGPLGVGDGAPNAPPVLLPDVRFVDPRQGIVYRGPGFTIDMPAGSRFYPGPLAVRTEPIAGPDGLPAMADAVEILPDGEALDARATLAFELAVSTPEARPLGIYRWDRQRGRWAYEGGDADAAGRSIRLAFRRYGRFALLQDAAPPRILDVTPAPGARQVSRSPRFAARVEDEGEGLDADGVRFVLDGIALESEFDPDHDRSAAIDPPALSPGPHVLTVTAIDRAGNLSEIVESRFTVR
jgi:hypothetical protein